MASAGAIDGDGELDVFLHYSNLSYIPTYLDTIFKEIVPSYYIDYTKTSNSYYYVNHCKCNAKLGDFYLHNEPEGAFFPICKEHAQDITMYNLGIYGSVNIDADFGFDDIKLIPKYANREKIF